MLTYYEYRQKHFGNQSPIGLGAYAAVFQHEDPDLVVKISNSDQAYHLYATWAQKNQHNPFVPRIFSHERVDLKFDFYTVTVLEALDPLDPQLVKPILSRVGFESLEELQDSFESCGSSISNGFIKDIFDFRKSSKRYLDLGRQNLMLRYDQLVFTDPVC